MVQHSKHDPGERSRCRAAFEKGLLDRKKYPLPHGAYKLDEVVERIEREAAFDRTNVTKQGRLNPRSALLRIPRRLPEMIAWDLGYNVVPAVAALVGDGVPASQVQDLLRTARERAVEIVHQCDLLRFQLRVTRHRTTAVFDDEQIIVPQVLLMETATLIRSVLKECVLSRAA